MHPCLLVLIFSPSKQILKVKLMLKKHLKCIRVKDFVGIMVLKCFYPSEQRGKVKLCGQMVTTT